MSVSYLGFNTQKPPFDDPKVRQAFGYAIDREKIVEVVLKDMLPVAHSIMPPGLPGYNPSATRRRVRPGEGEAAAGGIEVRRRQRPAQDHAQPRSAAAPPPATTPRRWSRCGSRTWASTSRSSRRRQATFCEDLDKRPYQMFAAGWIMDYPDPEDILDILFNSKSRQNNTGYSNPEVDALLVQARTEQDVRQAPGALPAGRADRPGRRRPGCRSTTGATMSWSSPT